MSQNYFVLLTKVGQAQLSNAIAMGRKLNVSYVQLGDGGTNEGKETHPTENDTQLKRTRGQVPVNAVFQHESNPHWVVFQVVIPDDVGGFYITELGLFDDNDNLIAIGKYPKTYKATLPDGISTSMDLDVICQVGNADNVELKIDPSKVLATVDYTEKRFKDHLAAEDPHPQYVQKDIYNVEKKFTGTPGEIGSISHCVLQGIVYQTTTHIDSNTGSKSIPNSAGDFPVVDLNTDNNVYCHFVTPFNLNQHDHMFWFNVRGYSYGSTKEVDEIVVGYCYSVEKKLLSTNTRGNFSPALYVDKYGNIIFSLLFDGIYYTTMMIDSLKVGNGRDIYRGEIKAILSLQEKIDYPSN